MLLLHHCPANPFIANCHTNFKGPTPDHHIAPRSQDFFRHPTHNQVGPRRLAVHRERIGVTKEWIGLHSGGLLHSVK